MTLTTSDERRRLEALDATRLAGLQLERLNCLLATILPGNGFYAAKLGRLSRPLTSLEQLAELPFTSKAELQQHGADWATNLTYPIEAYVRCHRTSGSHGRPLTVLDTPADWEWWLDVWQFPLDMAELSGTDRAFMAFSYGPYIGFWTAHDASIARGALVIPGGGLRTPARLDLLRTLGVTAVFCTPSYALHMAEIAAEQGFDLAALPVRCLIVAGEPGGSVPAIRQRIETAWDARVVDHAGATEIGPWGYGDREGRGLYVVESEFIAEFPALDTGQPAGDGQLAELVLTTLGRAGSPVIRYRTGDVVRPSWRKPGNNRFVFLEGGVLGRTDAMLLIRGVNVFPSAIEQILRGFPEIVEYRVTARKAGQLDALTVEIEDRRGQPERVVDEFRLRLGLTVEVRCVPVGSLPRFEGKGARFVDQRKVL